MAFALLARPALAEGCYRWNLTGEWLLEPGLLKPDDAQPTRFVALRLVQQGEALSGKATVTSFEDFNTATLTGKVTGDTMTLQTDWPTQGRGIVEYSGKIAADGSVSGSAKNWSHPASTWLWRLGRPAPCGMRRSPAETAAGERLPNLGKPSASSEVTRKVKEAPPIPPHGP